MTILYFISAIILSFLPGAFGVLFSPTGTPDAWYSTLNISVLNPPAWVFPIAWNILYLLLGIALFLIIKNGFKKSKKALPIFALHMILNGLWSYLFFGLHLIFISALTIVLLIIIALWMRKEFSKINRTAGLLVLPYIAWLCFALYLNITVFVLN